MVVIRDKRKHTIKIDYYKVVISALSNSFNLLRIHNYLKNPLLLLLTLCFFIGLVLVIFPSFYGHTNLSRFDNIFITFLLFSMIYFSNFANNLVVKLGEEQTDSLKILQGDIEIRKVVGEDSYEYVFSSTLQKGDVIKVFEGEFIPVDGEVIEGIATVDESAITGESSFVLKEPGTETSSSVTGGTRVVSDWLLIRVTSEHGNSYIDQMSSITYSIENDKSPNNIFINLIIIYCICFVLLITVFPHTLKIFHLHIEFTYLIALICCLLPTLYTALSKPLLIAAIDKIKSMNVIVLRDDILEKVASINVVFLDKTGTITIGSRIAHEFIPLGKNSILDVAKAGYISSFHDITPEGKSILNLANRLLNKTTLEDVTGNPIQFNSNTRLSGIDFSNGDFIKKGAPDVIKKMAMNLNIIIPENLDQLIQSIAIQGGTPLLILNSTSLIGLIHLKDILKPNIKDKFNQLTSLGIKTVMCTGDDAITANVISKIVGVNEYIAQARPEDKINLIREYQSKGMIVAMSGDGNNDAPALAQADIAIAMNTGTIAAKEASNMIDLDSDPTKIIDLIKICKKMIYTNQCLIVFSTFNTILKFSLLLPVLFSVFGFSKFQVYFLGSNHSSIMSIMLFSALIIPLFIPFVIRGFDGFNVNNKLKFSNVLFFGAFGVIISFLLIKSIDSLIYNLIT